MVKVSQKNKSDTQVCGNMHHLKPKHNQIYCTVVITS